MITHPTRFSLQLRLACLALLGVLPAGAADERFSAHNPEHGLVARFDGQGFELSVSTPSGRHHEVTWRLVQLGFGEAMEIVPAGTVSAVGEQIEIARASPAVTEWLINAESGLEHGFTLPHRPAAAPAAGPLRLEMSVGGGLQPRLADAGQRLELHDDTGNTVLSYAKLQVWDAVGSRFPAEMEVCGKIVALVVDEATARYPLTVDPIFRQEAYAKAANAGEFDVFGSSLAVSGETIVIGAPGEASSATGADGDATDDGAGASGAAYVFTRENGSWRQQAYLKASNTGRRDRFGYAVALSGDTLVVGAIWEGSDATAVDGDGSNDRAPTSGAAYVFVRHDGAWRQQAYLKSSHTSSGANFGAAVAVSGERVAVGAPQEDGASGSVYVFAREGATWREVARLRPAGTEPGDRFGASLAIAGDTLVAGSPLEDSGSTGIGGDDADNSAEDSGAAYVFHRSPDGWGLATFVKASNTGSGDHFGESVAISGKCLIVGAPGEASRTTEVGGIESDDGGPSTGAAYVFVNDQETGWRQQAYLKARNAETGDRFANAVGISADWAIIAAGAEDGNGVGIGGDGTEGDETAQDSGAVYVFLRSGTTWNQQAYLKASDAKNFDRFGSSVAISGSLAASGSPFEDGGAIGIDGAGEENGAPESGAAYFFSVPPRPTGQITAIVREPASLRLAICPLPGQVIGVEYSPDLTPGSWIELGNFFQTSSDWAFIDPDPLRFSRASGYYRAFLRPPSP